jgi:glycosyltransferase involved in cell wall biosynthesis
MTIGLLLPSLLMTKRFSDRIFAPKPLFLALVDGLVAHGHTVYVYSAPETLTSGILVTGNTLLSQQDIPSVRIREGDEKMQATIGTALTAYEYELELTMRAFAHAKHHGVEVMHSYQQFMAHYASQLMPDMPVVYTLHDPLFDSKTLEGFRVRHFLNDNYIAISNNQAEGYKAHGVHVVATIHHGIDVSHRIFTASSKDYALFMGRLIPEKGLTDAIDAVEALHMPLHIATSGNYHTSEYGKTVLERIQKEPDRFPVYDFLAAPQHDALIGGAKALLFPIGWDEPFGLVMIEAMACGTPVIAYNRGSVAEVIKDGVTGFIIDPDDTDRSGKGSWVIKSQGVEGLIEALKRIGEIDRAACRAHVEQYFTVETMTKKHEEVYEKILRH